MLESLTLFTLGQNASPLRHSIADEHQQRHCLLREWSPADAISTEILFAKASNTKRFQLSAQI